MMLEELFKKSLEPIPSRKLESLLGLSNPLYGNGDINKQPLKLYAQGQHQSTTSLSTLLGITKRKVFISYHHKDQNWVNSFSTTFGKSYGLFTDCSLDEAIDSNNLHYVNRTIREEYITGTSITIVLCGADTWRRKCVDWEIYSTLDKDHALLGIVLPHNSVYQNGQHVSLVPNRLFQNIQSGYAHWIHWSTDALALSNAITTAINNSNTNKSKKNNYESKQARNL